MITEHFAQVLLQVAHRAEAGETTERDARTIRSVIPKLLHIVTQSRHVTAFLSISFVINCVVLVLTHLNYIDPRFALILIFESSTIFTLIVIAIVSRHLRAE